MIEQAVTSIFLILVLLFCSLLTLFSLVEKRYYKSLVWFILTLVIFFLIREQ